MARAACTARGPLFAGRRRRFTIEGIVAALPEPATFAMTSALIRSKKVLIMAAPISLGGELRGRLLRLNRVLTLELDSTSGVGVQTIEF